MNDKKFYSWLEENYIQGYLKDFFKDFVIVKDGDKTLQLLRHSDEFNEWLKNKEKEYENLQD